MRVLLDTHALIWALSAPARLPAGLRASIEDPANAVYASAASAWEIAIKEALGKITFPIERLADTLGSTGFVELPVGVRHAVALRGLPHHHRDPFDRLLVAQAITEDLVIATRDRVFAAYRVHTRWE